MLRKITSYLDGLVEKIQPLMKVLDIKPLAEKSRYHENYVNIASIFVSVNLASFFVLGWRLQWLAFGIVFLYNCKLTPLNVFHALLVVLHDYIHTYNTYYTVVEVGHTTMDEYWHAFYVVFILLRLHKALKYYKPILAVYLVLTCAALVSQQIYFFWALYASGFALAYILPWLESETPFTLKCFFYQLFHAAFSLIITSDNPLGRLALASIPAGGAFYGDAIMYGVWNDRYSSTFTVEGKAAKVEGKSVITGEKVE